MYSRLKEIRKILKLSQMQVAEETGILQKKISDIENNKVANIPNEYILYYYNKGVSLEWLYTGNGNPLISDEIKVPKTSSRVKEDSIDYNQSQSECNNCVLLSSQLEEKDKIIHSQEKIIETQEKTIEALEGQVADKTELINVLRGNQSNHCNSKAS